MLNPKCKSMKKWNAILGVDVSKKTLDVCCAGRRLHVRIENNSKGFSLLAKWCRDHSIGLGKVLLVMEYTGGYEYRLLQFCQAKGICYCRVPGLEIKHSMGMVRGKSDYSDSYRISRYGEEKPDLLEASKPLNNSILQLKQYLSFRKRLVRENAGLLSTVKERKFMYSVGEREFLVGMAREKIAANRKYIAEIEERIMQLVKADEAMCRNYRILVSIKGVGSINAWMAIAYTENFRSFTDARKYAVFVGVVPFEHTSGTSIRGRKRVSYLANKEIKQELNQAAKSAMRHDTEIRAYAERKLKDKAYPLVLNNVKFKLILRMFSLVKRGEEYVENYRRVA